MKTNKKQFLTALVLGVVMVILFVGGCKKEISSSDSENVKKPDLQMSSDGGTGKDKVLRQSPGLKFEVKTKTIGRISPKLKGVEQITTSLKALVKKKTNPGITSTSDVTFNVIPWGSDTYYCTGAVPTFDGPRDWYLINTHSWVYTYIGSTSGTEIQFYLDKPSMPGTYTLYAEGLNGSGFTDYASLGDPLVGVTNVGGVLEFTDKIALDAILARLEQAMEDHSSNFEDPLAYMTDDQLTDYAISVGFDEFLPMKEFEAYFGFYSLRQKIETEEIAWLATSDPWSASVYPDDNYTIEDDAERTVNNQYGQVKVGGVLIQPVSLTGGISETSACGPPYLWSCEYSKTNADNQPLSNNKMIRWKITKKEGASGGGTGLEPSMWFNSYVKAKIRRFRKQNGFWTKHKGKMSVRLFGKVYTSDGYNHCGDTRLYDTFDETKSYKRKYMRDEKEDWNAYTYVRPCEVGATFTVDGDVFTKYLH